MGSSLGGFIPGWVGGSVGGGSWEKELLEHQYSITTPYSITTRRSMNRLVLVHESTCSRTSIWNIHLEHLEHPSNPVLVLNIHLLEHPSNLEHLKHHISNIHRISNMQHASNRLLVVRCVAVSVVGCSGGSVEESVGGEYLLLVLAVLQYPRLVVPFVI